MATTPTTKALDQLIIRLARNHQTVKHLTKKINSYTYEPKNHECFIKLNRLRINLNELQKDQAQSLEQIQGHKQLTIDFEHEATVLLNRFQQLEKDIAAYLLKHTA